MLSKDITLWCCCDQGFFLFFNYLCPRADISFLDMNASRGLRCISTYLCIWDGSRYDDKTQKWLLRAQQISEEVSPTGFFNLLRTLIFGHISCQYIS